MLLLLKHTLIPSGRMSLHPLYGTALSTCLPHTLSHYMVVALLFISLTCL